MNIKIGKVFLGLLPVLLIGVAACDKDDKVASPPEASFSVVPENGNTTTIFKFNSNGSENPGIIDTMLFFRWDWNADGIWDTNFSRSRAFDHRFMQLGNYTVIMEASNKAGMRDTIRTDINVVQGYSRPQPQLLISPESGHVRTVFTLDGSATIDDEDEFSTLLFRWDWEGDGFWDTQFSSESVVEHMYTSPSNFHTIVQVKDPSGLTARKNHQVMVNLHNPKLYLNFSWTPVDGTTADVFTFDASSCSDPDDSENIFLYRWDFNGDGFYETDYLASPTVEYRFDYEGETKVRLEIMDKWGLKNTTIEELFIAHANRAPVARFFTAANYGNLTSSFYFDASGSSDDEDYIDDISVRWDFESDGIWDTEYSKTKTVYHAFGEVGEFQITVEAIDRGGLTATASLNVQVSGGTNPTGVIIDEDSGDTYGTVKIGNQWWMSENLKNSTNQYCYRNNDQYCETYGGLYSWSIAMAGSSNSGTRGLCPAGWHIPTQDEWLELINYFGESEVRAKLELGSGTDFRMLYSGQMSNTGVSDHLGNVTNFWTSTKATGDNAWAISFQANKDQVWNLSLGRSYRNSVRCIKN